MQNLSRNKIIELQSRIAELEEQTKHLVHTMHEQAHDFQTEIDKLKELDGSDNQSRIEENKSILKMAELHMDERAIFVIKERIKELGG